jgi:hypothetical protein
MLKAVIQGTILGFLVVKVKSSLRTFKDDTMTWWTGGTVGAGSAYLFRATDAMYYPSFSVGFVLLDL